MHFYYNICAKEVKTIPQYHRTCGKRVQTHNFNKPNISDINKIFSEYVNNHNKNY